MAYNVTLEIHKGFIRNYIFDYKIEPHNAWPPIGINGIYFNKDRGEWRKIVNTKTKIKLFEIYENGLKKITKPL